MEHLTEQQCIAYVLDQLSDAERQQVEDHAMSCPACASALAVAAANELALRDAMQSAAGAVPNGGRPPASAWFRVAAAVGGLVAAAAALFLAIRTPDLPDYSLSISATTQQLRSATDAPMYAGQPVDILLRPAQSTVSPRVELFVATPGGWRPLPGSLQHADSGAVRAQITAPQTPGPHTLVALIAPAGSPPATAEHIQGRAVPDGWQRLEEEVVFLASP